MTGTRWLRALFLGVALATAASIASGPASGTVVRHDDFEHFLLRNIRVGQDGVHRVAYAHVTDEDKARLDRYLDRLATVPLEQLSSGDRLAFWLNLYNALVIQLVLLHYPIDSILAIEGPNVEGPFALPMIKIGGRVLSLDDIRSEILTAEWNDPRIHFGLSCGAIGCPNLQPEPFVGSRVEDQLTEAAMAYVNDRRCLFIEDGELTVSSIYRWHEESFGGSDRAVIHHLMTYAEPELAKQLQSVRRIERDVFDWQLNDARGP